MTVFMQAVKTGALLPAHIAAGLWLDEDDHGLVLRHEILIRTKDGYLEQKGSEEIAHWGIYANLWEIQRTATKWLETQQKGG